MTRIGSALLIIFFSFFVWEEQAFIFAADNQGNQVKRVWRLTDGSTLSGIWQGEKAGARGIYLLKSGEKSYEVKLESLSSEDRAYIRSLLAEADFQEPVEENLQEHDFTVVLSGDFTKPGKVPGEKRSLIVNGSEFRFCWCPPGTFMMGSPEDEEYHEAYETIHEVTLTKGFWLLESEVTQQLWYFVTGRTIKDELRLNPPNVGGVFEADEMKKVERLGMGDSYPIYFISWNDANTFCKTLAAKTGLPVTFPTEAQWEYACRAGTLGPYSVTQNLETSLDSEGKETTLISMSDPSDICWYIENSGKGIHPVKQRMPNLWGLYDMHGNLWEMCLDRYSKDYYAVSPKEDPTGSQTGEYRVNRGGCWFSYLKFCRSSCRYRNAPDYRYNSLGFRIAINLP